MYLLDTVTVSETRRKTAYNLAVFDWLATVKADELFINTVVLMELERGVLAKERKDKAQGKVLRTWLDGTIKPAFEHRMLLIDKRTAEICASLHVPNKTPENDAWIIASALQHNLTLVTRNISDMNHTPVTLINPFDFKQ